MGGPKLDVAVKAQPWTPADATDAIRAIAKSDGLVLICTRHAREQMHERDLIMGDALYVLKQGFVIDDPQESTRAGLYKYRIQSRSPNSGNRSVRVVVIPDASRCTIKIATVMWVD